ncbi:MAG: hypothetical protein JO097_10895 [Acidobacteriaceae bacterium]|nr:hypothetical protein [Acidobacteriaceae bacterium]
MSRNRVLEWHDSTPRREFYSHTGWPLPNDLFYNFLYCVGLMLPLIQSGIIISVGIRAPG